MKPKMCQLVGDTGMVGAQHGGTAGGGMQVEKLFVDSWFEG